VKHYPHHIGDFDKATRHLTRIERSIYRDLIDLYYDTEQRLTLDLPMLCRRICANELSTDVERALNEFFTKTDTGWYHHRCEMEIEAYRANNSQRAQAGKASAAAKALKKQRAINETSTSVERALNERTDFVEVSNNGASTNQSTNQPINQSTNKGEVVAIGEGNAGEDSPPPKKSGAICMVLKSEGIAFVNPSHPGLLALIDAGADVGHFAEVAKACKAKGKASFAYVLAMVEGQMKDAAEVADMVLSAPTKNKPSLPLSFATQDAIREMLRWEEMTNQTHPDWHTVGGRPEPKKTVDMGFVIDANGLAPKRIAV
jgi:uncharacterized protein YdaU (DUF1376 family)